MTTRAQRRWMSFVTVVVLASCSACSSDPAAVGERGDGGPLQGGGGGGGGGGGVVDPPDGGGAATVGNTLQVRGGKYHTCARGRQGALHCWGQGAYGALGNDGSARPLPTRVLVVDDAVDVQTGARFSCARRASGAVFCWGEDLNLQLGGPPTKDCGDATIDSKCAPVPQVVAGLSNAVQLALGGRHACALTSDGAVSCWGSNDKGQLGKEAAGDQQSPAPVAGLSGVKRIASGEEHACALVGSPGRVLCWGANDASQASGAVADRVTAPREVPGLTDAVEIAAGGKHTCARRANGSVACWGYNYFGQLGNGSTRPTRAAEPQAVRALTNAVEIGLGRYHTCARRADGGVSCWGNNPKGELGDGTTTARTEPVNVVSLDDAASLALGHLHACAIRAAGPVVCWGDNLGGQLGIGSINKTENPTPVPVQNLP
ncbi:RCC1 domain-containing protein [Pendulispora albinea]|uniref:RCC1-like domain-containing protein n=1 Tax=Pendulispora albinea TaxID=2741071 RepID=A0ABZ2LWB4_9BACT